MEQGPTRVDDDPDGSGGFFCCQPYQDGLVPEHGQDRNRRWALARPLRKECDRWQA